MSISGIKLVLIFLVVLGHFVQYVFSKDNYLDNYLFKFIYSFHMPLFMFVSGYLYKPKSIDKFFKYLAVYLITGVFVLQKEILVLIAKPDEGFWYFYVLAGLYLIGNFLSNYIYIVILVPYIILLTIFDFDWRYFYYYGLFFLIGYIFNKYNIKLIVKARVKNKFIFGLILIITLMILPIMNNIIYLDKNSYFISYRLISPLIAILFILLIMRVSFINQGVTYRLSQYTGLVYIYHLIYLYDVEINPLNLFALFVVTLILCIKIKKH